MAKIEWQNLGDHLYRRRGIIYWRSQVDGHRSWVRLKARTLNEARAEVGKLIHRNHKLSTLLTSLLQFYMDHDCPKRNEQPRSGRQLSMEKRRAERLQHYLKDHHISDLTHATLRDYRKWRGETRACELDIATLAAACRWAYRNPDQTGVTTNPMPSDRPRFAATQQHCRDRQPLNAQELHLIARELIAGNDRSQIFGWMVLFLAFTGVRIGRAMEFRMDATNHNPGHHDGECIWVGSSQTHKGVFPFIRIHEALDMWWQSFQEWRLRSGVSSPWYFPSPSDPSRTVGQQSLEHAMRRVCSTLDMPKKSPHGLRSYYVNVLRSQGIMDAEIALRIGHRSGGRLIVDVYGEILPHPITFIPEGPAAWDVVTTTVTTQSGKLPPICSVTHEDARS